MYGVRVQFSPDLKSDEKAVQYREEGNKWFKKPNYINALVNYNKSIAYANSSLELALSYGNRSAVYLEVGRYSECLENIQLARKNGYPKNKEFKLIEREKKCKKFLSMETVRDMLIEAKGKTSPEDYSEFFKLSYPANKKIPWIVDRVEMRWTEKYGRGIYAKEDLKAGDIICIEVPIFNYFRENVFHQRCFNCFKVSMLNLIPCSRSATFMFCSNECKKGYYSKALDMRSILSFDGKTLSELVHLMGGKEKFDEFIERTDFENLNKTIFDYDFSDPNDPEYNQNIVTCFLSLFTGGKKLWKDDYPMTLAHEDTPRNKMKMVASKIGDYSQILDYVSRDLSDHIWKILILNTRDTLYYTKEDTAEDDGVVISLFMSLLNHSCVSNVSCTYFDNKVVVYVKRPIKAGEQIFLNYKRCEMETAELIAMTEILDIDNFKCDCKGCNGGDLPSMFSIPFIMKLAKAKNTIFYKTFEEGKKNLKLITDCINDENLPRSDDINYVLTCAILLKAMGHRGAFPCIP